MPSCSRSTCCRSRIARLWFVVVCAPGLWSEGRFSATGFSPRSAIGVDRHAVRGRAIAVGPRTAEDHPAVSPRHGDPRRTAPQPSTICSTSTPRCAPRARAVAWNYAGRARRTVRASGRSPPAATLRGPKSTGGYEEEAPSVTSRPTDRRVARRDLGKGGGSTCGRSEAHDPRAWVYSEVDEVRLAPPVERGRPVPRPALVDQLANRWAVRIVSIAAPAGYGKTTLLCQWLGVERRPVVWITCGWADGDPVVFMRKLAVALDRDQPMPDEVFDALGVQLRGPMEAFRRLRAALSARTTPFVLVFDDAHCLSGGEVIRSVSELATAMPGDCTLVCRAGRPRHPVGSPTHGRRARRARSLRPGPELR